MASIFVGVRIPPELYGKLEVRLTETGDSKSEVMIKALAAYLDYSLEDTSLASKVEALEQRVARMEAALGKCLT
jgi:predicted DNA-binding protein